MYDQHLVWFPHSKGELLLTKSHLGCTHPNSIVPKSGAKKTQQVHLANR